VHPNINKFFTTLQQSKTEENVKTRAQITFSYNLFLFPQSKVLNTKTSYFLVNNYKRSYLDFLQDVFYTL